MTKNYVGKYPKNYNSNVSQHIIARNLEISLFTIHNVIKRSFGEISALSLMSITKWHLKTAVSKV